VFGFMPYGRTAYAMATPSPNLRAAQVNRSLSENPTTGETKRRSAGFARAWRPGHACVEGRLHTFRLAAIFDLNISRDALVHAHEPFSDRRHRTGWIE
jgi:hypothetical protein